MLLVSILTVAMLAVPVMSMPTNGPNKVAVTVTMARNDGGGPGTIIDPNVITGPITHGHWLQGFDVTITFEDDSTLEGTLEIERKPVIVPQKEANRMIFTDYYIFTFPGIEPDTGFVGNGLVMLDNVKQLSKAYGMFQGTGDFEGQTLNIGHTWASYLSAVNPWYGYWLKCQVYP